MKNKNKFIKWLQNKGCEILPTTNQYEVLRWKGSEVGVVYTSGRTSGKYASQAISAYRSGKKWNGGPVSTGRHNSYRRQKELLLERDGCDCFYCGRLLGEDITVEHLLSLSSGGKNTLGNMVLAHFKCNQAAHNQTIAAKVKMALDGRLNNQHQTEVKQTTQTVYRCDHCNKPYFRRNAAEVHEKRCFKNPENHRPCFDCKHLSKKSVVLYEDHGWGESKRKMDLLFCNAKQTHLYTPQNEMKKNWVELGDEVNDPMPKECSQFESSFLEILNNQQF